MPMGELLRRVLLVMLPPLVLILVVLGSIFAGVATPTEAGALGALGAMLLAAMNRRLSFRALKEKQRVGARHRAPPDPEIGIARDFDAAILHRTQRPPHVGRNDQPRRTRIGSVERQVSGSNGEAKRPTEPMTIDDSRRLTGPSLLLDRPGGHSNRCAAAQIAVDQQVNTDAIQPAGQPAERGRHFDGGNHPPTPGAGQWAFARPTS